MRSFVGVNSEQMLLLIHVFVDLLGNHQIREKPDLTAKRSRDWLRAEQEMLKGGSSPAKNPGLRWHAAT